MEPLITLATVTLLLRAAGALGVRALRAWPVALRGGLAAMFALTGTVHFVGMRGELVAMVPPALPAPGLLVTATGVLELAGAAGLLWPRTARWAAVGLAALLVAMLPANVHLALTGTDLAPHQELLPRTAMQVLFLAAAATVALTAPRRLRGATPGPAGSRR
ncbi:DoxX family membrane protein [Nocardiopsis sp. LOL_012]|uniref:DoxX family protein n=1 Tax=Nocardiopsis sp. LOL_012 TaxID=3345409 RepID=UPI003A894D58